MECTGLEIQGYLQYCSLFLYFIYPINTRTNARPAHSCICKRALNLSLTGQGDHCAWLLDNVIYDSHWSSPQSMKCCYLLGRGCSHDRPPTETRSAEHLTGLLGQKRCTGSRVVAAGKGAGFMHVLRRKGHKERKQISPDSTGVFSLADIIILRK